MKKRFAPASILRAAGYKATPGRIALLELLRKNKKPLSIKEITRGIQDQDIDQVTAYRMLAALQEAGLVRQVNLRHGHADYELMTPDDHHHLVCVRCGRVEDFRGCDVSALVKKAVRQSRHFAMIDQHALELFGVCKACVKKG